MKVDPKSKIDKKRVDTKEFDLPETIFIRDIEDKVFQSIVLQCLAQIDDISLVEGNFIDHLLGRSSEGVTGIHAEQDDKNQAVKIRVEVNIVFGTNIPTKAEEIQTKIAEEITKLTGLHVSSIHVVFKNVTSLEQASKFAGQHTSSSHLMESSDGEDYSDEF
jgi:uncharacterized alkaline shock family protein YloU